MDWCPDLVLGMTHRHWVEGPVCSQDKALGTPPSSPISYPPLILQYQQVPPCPTSPFLLCTLRLKFMNILQRKIPQDPHSKSYIFLGFCICLTSLADQNGGKKLHIYGNFLKQNLSKVIETFFKSTRNDNCGRPNNGPQWCPCPNPQKLWICYFTFQGGIKAANRITVASQLALRWEEYSVLSPWPDESQRSLKVGEGGRRVSVRVMPCEKAWPGLCCLWRWREGLGPTLQKLSGKGKEMDPP